MDSSPQEITLATYRQIDRAVELIGEDCEAVLPFIAESMDAWSSATDLHRFLRNLFDQDSVMTDASGQERLVNYAQYGTSLYESGMKDFERLSDDFRSRAGEVPAAPGANRNLLSEIPDFRSDRSFGLMAKYAIAWSAVASALLSEDGFFSIAHTLELEDEAQCSIVLASHGYLRQARQVLRNIIEEVFAQIYLCDDDQSFHKWRRGEYRIPQLRGKSGLLKQLIERSVLPEPMGEKAGQVYGTLCADVHGAEHRLNNAGIFEGQWTGRAFRHDRFAEWCLIFAETIDVSIRAQRLLSTRWLEILPKGKPFCSVCHNSSDWIRKPKEFAGRTYVILTCSSCSHTMTLSEDRLRAAADQD